MRTCRQLLACFSVSVLTTALAFAPAFVYGQPSGQENGAKQDMKDAGHETKEAAKDAGRSVKKETKKAYHSTKKGTKKAWNKTKDTTKGAVNGAKEGARDSDGH